MPWAPLGLGGLLVRVRPDQQDELVQPVLLAFRKLVLQAFRKRVQPVLRLQVPQAFRKRVPPAPLGQQSLDRPAGPALLGEVSRARPDPVERHRQDPQDHQ